MQAKISDLSQPVSIIRPINQFEQMLMEESLAEHGLLTPLVVCEDTIVDGYRRWLAARSLGWEEITVNPVKGDPHQLRVICQTRNSEFGKTEKKVLVAQYLERDPNASATQIANDFKWSPLEVEELCCLGYVCPPVKAGYETGDITLAAAWAMGRLLDEAQLEVLDNCDDLSKLQEYAEEQIRVVKHSRRRSMTQRPRVKSYGNMAKEAEHPVYAGPELIAADAKTPLDGWVAALKWAISGK